MALDEKFLELGLRGLARAHRAGAMAGHPGAAVAAGFLIGGALPGLDNRVYAAIEKDMLSIMAGAESIWFDEAEAGISVAGLFEPFPEESCDPQLCRRLVDALAENISITRESGHNVIFTAIAARALHEHPDLATPAIVDGICRLILLFNNTGPGQGYYGRERGWIKGAEIRLPDEGEFPVHHSRQSMVESVIDELIASVAVRRQGYGSLFHIINHAAALVDLARLGYSDLADRGLAAHQHHMRLWRNLPDMEEELGPLKKAEFDPRTLDYWQSSRGSQWSAHLTHRIKTLYGFFTILDHIDDRQKRRDAEDAFLYLM